MNIPGIVAVLADILPMATRLFQKDAKVAQDMAHIAAKLTGSHDPLDIKHALQSDPKLLLEFCTTLMAIEKDLDEASLKDIQQARLTAGSDALRIHIMLCVAVFGFGLCLWLLYEGSCSAEAVGILSTACGIFGSCLKDIYAFQFGWRRR